MRSLVTASLISLTQSKEVARNAGYTLTEDYGGHGIGREMQKINDSQCRTSGHGPVLRKGMCLAIEPMLNVGSPELRIFGRWLGELRA